MAFAGPSRRCARLVRLGAAARGARGRSVAICATSAGRLPASYRPRIARSPAFHYEPETNGCAEKFIQTLKEQVLWIQRFQTFEELRAAVRSFADTYNQSWLLERHGYRTPIEAREHLLALTPTTLA
jgi:hypothetical protein